MPAEDLLQEVEELVNQQHLASSLGFFGHVRVSYLAQGEYNLCFLLDDGHLRLVMIANTKSQIGLPNQTSYEYQTLALLDNSQVTPRVYYMDDSKEQIPYGFVIMEYLPGRILDYRKDLKRAAKTLARIHSLEYSQQQTDFLIKEPEPLTGIYNESLWMLQPFLDDPKASQEIKKLLLFWADEADRRRAEEKALRADPWLRVVNTDLHNENFILNDEAGTCHLIDWEKPNFGEPAKDICHFIQVTTTLFKTDFAFTAQGEAEFLQMYYDLLPPCPQKASFFDRIKMFQFFTLFRAVTWGGMAWSDYMAQDSSKLKNSDTFKVIEFMMAPDYLRHLMRDKLDAKNVP